MFGLRVPRIIRLFRCVDLREDECVSVLFFDRVGDLAPINDQEKGQRTILLVKVTEVANRRKPQLFAQQLQVDAEDAISVRAEIRFADRIKPG